MQIKYKTEIEQVTATFYGLKKFKQQIQSIFVNFYVLLPRIIFKLMPSALCTPPFLFGYASDYNPNNDLIQRDLEKIAHVRRISKLVETFLQTCCDFFHAKKKSFSEKL